MPGRKQSSRQLLAMQQDKSIPGEIKFHKRTSLSATPERLDAMKAMVRQAKQNPFILLENFELPEDLLMEQLMHLHVKRSFTVNNSRSNSDVTKELNGMKAMVEQAKKDPTSLLKNFALPNDLLTKQSKEYIRLHEPLHCTRSKIYICKAA